MKIKVEAMNRVIILLAAIAVTAGAMVGCDPPPMSNDDIVREVKKCQDAGLEPEFGRDWGGNTRRVQCGPKESK